MFDRGFGIQGQDHMPTMLELPELLLLPLLAAATTKQLIEMIDSNRQHMCNSRANLCRVEYAQFSLCGPTNPGPQTPQHTHG